VADASDGVWDALRQLVRETLHIVDDWWQADEEEEGQSAKNTDEQNENRDRSRRGTMADLDLGDAIDQGHQHDGKECADIQDFDLFEQLVGDCEQEEDCNSEDDVGTRGGSTLSGNRGERRGGSGNVLVRFSGRGEGINWVRQGLSPLDSIVWMQPWTELREKFYLIGEKQS
jgi:hypothetical protein